MATVGYRAIHGSLNGRNDAPAVPITSPEEGDRDGRLGRLEAYGPLKPPNLACVLDAACAGRQMSRAPRSRPAERGARRGCRSGSLPGAVPARSPDETNHASGRRGSCDCGRTQASGPCTDRKPHRVLEPLPVGAADEHARLEPTGLRDPHPGPGAAASKETDRTPGGTVASSAVQKDHRVRCSRTRKQARVVPQIQVEGVANHGGGRGSEGARVSKSGRGMGVEVTERDHDDDRQRRCDRPCRPIIMSP